MPLLQWAYIERATIHLIRVGARNATHELRADHTSFRNVLAPRFAPLLFQTAAGRASPLAHGLALARQALLHLLQSGRSGFSEARLVVLSDGRGNVPLAASAEGRLRTPAGRNGVADALALAREISQIKKAGAYLLDLEPAHRREYQDMLGAALGARMIPLRQ
jgi:magnesium chelatase subunit D